MLRAGSDTHRGRVRSANEDSLIVEPQLGLFAVLDGMGGHAAGEVASRLASDTIRAFVQQRAAQPPRELLDAAIAAAAVEVFTAARDQIDHQGMGTTVVACLVVDATHVVIGHVGDSRAYLLRHGQLQQLTRDHTVAEDWIDLGVIPPEAAQRYFGKDVLTRSLGAVPGVHPDLAELDLEAGDRVLLCSDGLNNYAAREAIERVLGAHDVPEHAARELVELALRGGGGDNVSAIVLVPGAI